MNYYNDNDPKACAWLRELIAKGHLPPGTVDERSICDIKPDELRGFDQCHFFAGIGGWPLALRWAGLEGVAGIWTGSCPCQPLSCAGKRQGHADERHLWPTFYNLIAECKPATVFGEQVASKDGREWFAGVRLDLEGLGYACGGADLCAAGVGAPHRRQRLFWVADANMPGRDQRARSGQQPIRDEDLRPDAVADAEHDGGRADEPGREAQGRAADGRACSVAHPADGGQRGERDGTEGRGESGRDCCMGDATGGGCGVGGDAAQPGRGGHAERAGWARCDILPCRDGKARRAPAWSLEPIFQLLADGIWCSMVPGWSESVEGIQERTMNHATETRSGAGEVLRALRQATEQEAIRERVGGHDAIQGATILLFALLQLEGQMGQIIECDAPGVLQDGGACVPALRGAAEGVARPPQERRLDGQQAGELHDLVSALSQELAQRHEEAAQIAVACMGSPIVGKIPGRMGLLRGYGNAIVPACAQIFIEAAIEAINETMHKV